jgi:hypothetical protein
MEVSRLGKKNKWLTKFNEFTGAKWPALLNDISQPRYTPVLGGVNSQIFLARPNHSGPTKTPGRQRFYRMMTLP